jgi:hypothetical protein
MLHISFMTASKFLTTDMDIDLDHLHVLEFGGIAAGIGAPFFYGWVFDKYPQKLVYYNGVMSIVSLVMYWMCL